MRKNFQLYMELSVNPKPAVMAHVYSPSMQGRREQFRGISMGISRGQPWPHSEFQAGLGYTLWSHKKNMNKCLMFPSVVLRVQ